MSNDNQMNTEKWKIGHFRDNSIRGAMESLLYIRRTNLFHLLNEEYAVTLSMDYIRSAELESRIIDDWIGFLSESSDTQGDFIYKIAKRIHELRDGDSRETGEIGAIKQKLERFFKVALSVNEKDVEQLINKYLSAVGNVGLVGIDKITDNSIPEVIEAIGKRFALADVYESVRVENEELFMQCNLRKENLKTENRTLREINNNHALIVKRLLIRIKDTPEFASAADNLFIRFKTRYQKEEGNLNLGLEELALIYMKPETLRYFEIEEGNLIGKKMEYRNIDEIATFMDFYLKLRDENERFSENVTNRNFENRLADLRSKDNLDGIIKEMCLYGDDSIEPQIKELHGDINERNLNEIECIIRDWGKYNLTLNRFEGYFYDNLVSGYYPTLKDNPEALTYLKIKVAEKLATNNLADVMLLAADKRTEQEIEFFENVRSDVMSLSSWANSLCLMPAKTCRYITIFESYMIALSRRKEQIKYKKYMVIWRSLLKNFDITKRISEEEKDKKVSELNDSELGMILVGKRVDRIYKRKAVVEHVTEWLSSLGYAFDAGCIMDFKVVYDAIYSFSVDKTLEENKIIVQLNEMKKAENFGKQYTEDQKAYLKLAVYLSLLYNRSDCDVKYVALLWKIIDEVMEVQYHTFDLVNYDEILIFLNAFRCGWKQWIAAEFEADLNQFNRR